MPTRGTTEAPTTGPRRRLPPDPPRVERDVRRKRPPALSFLLRMDTLRRVARVVSLLALDFAASSWRSSPRWGSRRPRAHAWDPSVALPPGQGLRVLRLPRHGAAVRAPGSTPTAPSARGCRASSPRCSRSTVVALLFAVVSGRTSPATTSSTARCSSRSPTCRRSASPTSARPAAAARRRLPAPRGARRHRRAHRGRRPRAARAAAGTTSTSSASSR